MQKSHPFPSFSPLFGTGFAQTETPVKVDKPLKSYSHWYFGAEYGVPFLFGDFTSFSADKTMSDLSLEGLPVIRLIRG